MTAPRPQRDATAYAAARAAGMVNLATASTVSELSPEGAVVRALTWHLAGLSGRLDDLTGGGDTTTLAFADVLEDWPTSWQAAKYPMAVLSTESSRRFDSAIGTPFQDPRDDTVDLLSGDGKWALWQTGEDVGQSRVMIFAANEESARALGTAVQSSLGGSLNPFFCLNLPLPEAALPPPFQGLLDPSLWPHITLWALDGGGARPNAGEARSNAWRFDVRFFWQAPRYEARPALPNLNPAVRITAA